MKTKILIKVQIPLAIFALQACDDYESDHTTKSFTLETEEFNQCLRREPRNCFGPILNPFPRCPYGETPLFVDGNCLTGECVPYDQCSDIPLECDYSNADDNDGFGWNPSTQETCPRRPLVQIIGCDYTDAEFNNGWGHDFLTGESCPPLETDVPVNTSPPETPPPTEQEEECDYSDAAQNGGWGWNSQTSESCPPLATNNPVNNPPGAPTPSAQEDECDYSDAAQNGGWGWNSQTAESCPPRLLPSPINNPPGAPGSSVSDPASPDCDYSLPEAFGGWGWNAVTGEYCPPLENNN